MKKKLLTIAMLALPSVCWATDYYIREDGTAANKETAVDCLLASTAMSVVTHNAETFSPGDNIYLCDDGGPLALTPQNMPSSGSAAGYITYDGDPDGDGVKTEQQRAMTGTGLDYIKFQNIKFTSVAKGVILNAGCQYPWVTSCEFENTQQGIFAVGLDSDNYSDHGVVENSVFTNVGSYGDSAAADINLSGFARRWTFRNNQHIGDGSAYGVDGITFSHNNVAGGDGSGFIIQNETCSGMEENCLDFKGTLESSAGEGPTTVSDCVLSAVGGTEGLVHIHNNTNNIIFDKVKFLDTSANAIALVGVGVGDDACGYITVKHCLFSGIAKTIFTDAGLVDAEALGHNIFYNNTMLDSGQTTAGYSIDIGSNNNTFQNNIFYQSSQNATNDMIFRFNTGAFYDSATLDYNIYKKIDEATLTVVSVTSVDNKTIEEMQADGNETNGSYVDPQLDAQGRLTARSPYAVKRGGALLDGYPSIAGKYGYLGAYPYNEGTKHPVRQLSTFGGAGQLGGGVVYNAPAEEYLGNYFLDGSTVFLDGSTYFVDGGL